MKGKKVIFTREQEKEIVKLYKEDLLNPIKIGKIFGYGRKPIARILKNHSINMDLSYRRKLLFKKGKLIPWDKNLKGWTKNYENAGFQKGNKINLGKKYPPMSEKHRKNLSLAKKGKPAHNKLNLPENKIIELYGKLSSNKIAKKFRCSTQVICRILKENNIKVKKHGFFLKNKSSYFRTKKWRENMRIINLGKRNPMYGKTGELCHLWEGGKSFEPYGLEFNKELKEQIRKRDDFTCQECGIIQEMLKYKLSIHHIDYNKQNNSVFNLISLCKKCHVITNLNRKHWTNYFKMKIFLKEFFNPQNIKVFNENRQLIAMERIK